MRQPRAVYDKKYRNRPDVKAREAERKARMLRDTQHRAKILARAAFKWAIRSGEIKRQPCEVCGNPLSQGHHHDYHKPFDVRWLCAEHHKAEHARAIEKGE